MANELTNIFNASVKRPKNTNPAREPSIQMSMLGTACLRKLFYSYNKVPEDQGMPLKNARIVRLGDYIEMMLIDAYRAAGVLIDYVLPDGTTPIFYGKPNKQFRISYPEFGIKLSLLDAIVNIDGKIYVVEIKSEKSDYWQHLNQAKESHYIQGLFNLYLFNTALQRGDFKHIKALDGVSQAEGLKIVYYSKNDSMPKEFDYGSNEKDFLTLIEKIFAVKDFSTKRVLPTKTPEYCNNCNWNKKCETNTLGLNYERS